jgi:hypothetical protein
LPALAATTPAPFALSSRAASALVAPRILNEPVRCRFSAFRKTGVPAISDSASAGSVGVSLTSGAIVAAARSMSSGVTATSARGGMDQA